MLGPSPRLPDLNTNRPYDNSDHLNKYLHNRGARVQTKQDKSFHILYNKNVLLEKRDPRALGLNLYLITVQSWIIDQRTYVCVRSDSIDMYYLWKWLITELCSNQIDKKLLHIWDKWTDSWLVIAIHSASLIGHESLLDKSFQTIAPLHNWATLAFTLLTSVVKDQWERGERTIVIGKYWSWWISMNAVILL